MLHIEIDGQPVDVPEGSTVMDAADKLGIYIPRFCYHKKLTVAANCRMCLVDVEKAPKPLPACATPVTDGMKVATRSDKATKAQKGVMEFLLINHPLDCPICDQGGECQLQDLAIGFGGVQSRYTEEKRVVVNKNLGPLIATDMTRCIHCTRCVRFGQEVGGVMELGMAARGEHAEIMPFIAQTVDSELSGNMIDLCPVGALTSKPFRYTARSWELSRRPTISPHDGLGANMSVHIFKDRVKRVVPRENEAINECWLSDRDRFSYEALNSPERLTQPLIKQQGQWRETDWQTALEFVAKRLQETKDQHGADAIGALASPHSTLEELYLLQKLMHELGSPHVDFRLRHVDFSTDAQQSGIPHLGQSIESLSELNAALVVGSVLRKEQPLLAHRLRQAVKRGAALNRINPIADELLCRVANEIITAPSNMPLALAQVVKAVASEKGIELEPAYRDALAHITSEAQAQAIAKSLIAGEANAILFGNLAQHHPQAGVLHSLGLELARLTGAKFGFMGEAANSVGGYVAGAWPQTGGLNAAAMLAQPRKAYVLLNLEPELDCHDPLQAENAMMQAEFVVSLTAFKHRAADYAEVMLPIAPFTETSGTYINTEGRVQSFNAVVKLQGETRPAWKVLRVLGNLLELPGFEFTSTEQVRAACLPGGEAEVAKRLNNGLKQPGLAGLHHAAADLERIGDVPIYQSDALVRRAPALQATRDAQPPCAWMRGSMLQQLGLHEGDTILLKQGAGQLHLPVARDDHLPENCVRVAAGHPLTSKLGAMFGSISVERA